MFFWATFTVLLAQNAFAEEGKISINGDFRYRHREIDQQFVGPSHADQIRARFGLTSKINDHFSSGIRVATGTSNGPTGTLDTMDNNFTKKSLYLDQAWASWVANNSMPVLTVGKMKSPFVDVGDTGLIIDSDVNPEGFSGVWSMSGFFAKMAHYVLDDDIYRTNSNLDGLQLGYDADLGGNHIIVGGSYFDFSKSKQVVLGSASGNTTTPSYDYNLVELFARFDWNDLLPLSFYVDLVQNDDPSNDEKAWVAGTVVKLCEKAWMVGYDYRDTGKDAVVGYFNDSDFAGGGTDNHGHRVFTSYKLSSNVVFGVTYFNNHQQVSTTNRTQRDRSYQRAQFDATFTL